MIRMPWDPGRLRDKLLAENRNMRVIHTDFGLGGDLQVVRDSPKPAVHSELFKIGILGCRFEGI